MTISTAEPAMTATTMKAIVRDRYGPPGQVLELRDVARPPVGDDEVLVKVHAAGVAIGDWIMLTASIWLVRLFEGLFTPKHKILGRDVAGTVEAVGKNVTRLRPGDEVYGEIDWGAFAEYAVAPENLLAKKPSNLTFEEAAAVPVPAITALQGLRDHGKVQASQRVAINGASGAVGTFAAQLGKALGAEVTTVCSTRNVEMCREIGADHVSDYTQEDFTQTGERYDLIFDLVASRPLKSFRGALTENGLYVSSAGRMGWLLKVGLASIVDKQVKVMPEAKSNLADLQTLTGMLESGKIRPVIDRTYTLEEIPEALRHQGEGHARGKKVVIVAR
jgi:NADPH:quinone reductase-like Zn-dependent oxidoreductase